MPNDVGVCCLPRPAPAADADAFVVFQGGVDTEKMTTVTGTATRGDTQLTVRAAALRLPAS